jgi:hypothetical protein
MEEAFYGWPQFVHAVVRVEEVQILRDRGVTSKLDSQSLSWKSE